MNRGIHRGWGGGGGYYVQSADFDLDWLRFEMQRRYVNANTITERLNNFDVGKYRVQNFLEEILSNVDILNIDFARKKFAAHVFAAEVFKEHREILVEYRCNELGHSMVVIVVHSKLPKSFSPIAMGATRESESTGCGRRRK